MRYIDQLELSTFLKFHRRNGRRDAPASFSPFFVTRLSTVTITANKANTALAMMNDRNYGWLVA